MSLELSFPEQDELLDLDIFDDEPAVPEDKKSSDQEESSAGESDSESSESSDDSDMEDDQGGSIGVPILSDRALNRLTIVPKPMDTDEQEKERKKLLEEIKQTKVKKASRRVKNEPKKPKIVRAKPRWVRVTKQNQLDSVNKHK